MKKITIAFLLLLTMSVMLSADENKDAVHPDLGFDCNLRLGVSFPVIPFGGIFETIGEIGSTEAAVVGYTLVTITLSSVSIGGGAQYTFIPHLIAPGVYVDMHFNLLTWGLVYTFSNYHLILLQTGLRFYNQFKFNEVALEPFFGTNLVVIGVDDDLVPIPLFSAGFILNIGTVGFEYGYNFLPGKTAENLPFSAIHRLTLWFKIPLGIK